MAELVGRVRRALRDGELPTPTAPDPRLLAGPLPAVRVAVDNVAVVAAAGRRGLLAAVAGCLAVHRLDVISADVSTVHGRVLVECVVHPRYGIAADPAVLAADLRRVAVGEARVAREPDQSPGRRTAAGVPGRRTAAGAPARVVWHEEAATGATVLELRAADTPGLLSRVAAALDQAGAAVRAARISTLGPAVVDAFYLVGRWSDPTERELVEACVLAAAA